MVIRKLTRSLVSILVIASTLLAVVPSGSSAALGGNGLRVSPVRSDITIKSGTSLVQNIIVTNVQTAPAQLQAIINDFSASSDESGNPAILVNGNQYAPTNSLKRFVEPIPGIINVPAGQSVTVPVTINVPANAAGGGYYGLVRFSPANSASSPTKNLSLAGSVGSLILLTVPGNIVNKLSITSFDARVNDMPKTLYFSSKGIDSVIRFQNEGNIQEQPFGKIILKNHSGKELYSTEVNNTSPRSNVLPNSIRKFTIPLQHVGTFGIYTIEGNFGYGPNGQLLSASTTFYVVPVYAIVAFILLVLLIIFLVFGLPRIIKAYNQRVIAKATRGGSRK
ncbi:MAG TPA: hypothetical protein VIH90_00295 [Candidatus Saccharimonadales bacterium]